MLLIPLFATIGKVASLQGSAQVQRSTQNLNVKKGFDIQIKDELNTAASSKAQVILNDDTVITIGPDSSYLFESYNDTKDPQTTMFLKRGFFKAVTGKIGKIAPEKFKIRTRAATIGVRGTQFMAYVSSGEERIGCLQGRIIVWTQQGEFTVEAGEMLWYKNGAWRRTLLDITAFQPVMVGMDTLKDYPFYQHLFLPRFSNSYLLQEQMLMDLQAKDPFSFNLGFDPTTPPPFGQTP